MTKVNLQQSSQCLSFSEFERSGASFDFADCRLRGKVQSFCDIGLCHTSTAPHPAHI